MELSSKKDSCLLLEKGEDSAGQGEFVKSSEIHSLLQGASTKPEVVFLAACHSEYVGNVFVNSGIRHVVCIQSNQEVDDKVAISFTRFFYKELMN